MMDDELLTAQDVAEILKVKKTFAYDLMRRGELPVVELGKRAKRVCRSDLEEFIKKSRKVREN